MVNLNQALHVASAEGLHMKELVPLALEGSGLNRRKWEEEWMLNNDPSLLSFGTADMDFKAPQAILDAISGVVEKGHLGYQFIPDEYYKAIEDWLEELSGWKIDAKSSTSHNVGIYMSIWMILEAIASPGDEVIIQTPVHFCFKEMLKDNGLVPVENELKRMGDSYTMDFEDLERCFSPRTKAVWICNPHNPVGRAWSRGELERLAAICLKHDVVIISDDVYCGLLYDGASYTPVASLSPEVSQRTVTCYSTSKIYNTTGLRYSFIVTESKDLMEKYITVLHRLDMTYGISTIGIVSTTAAFTKAGSWLHEVMEQVQENYKVLEDAAGRLSGVKLFKPDATYFAWLDLSCLGLDPGELGERLLKDAHLVVENGAHLGKGGEGCIRVNLGCGESTLRRGLERLTGFYNTIMG